MKNNVIVIQRISDVELPPDTDRVSTGIAALDTCLAADDDQPGGLPIGSSVLLSGAPGGGKSTIALIAANASGNAIIFHGEEPATSVKRRWVRLGLSGDPFLCSNLGAEDICQIIRDVQPGIVIVDSIQTLSIEGKRNRRSHTEALEMVVGQAASSGATIIAVCHVNKSGDSHLGDNSMAHLVDVHIHINSDAKKSSRTLEVRKNRNGRAGFDVPMVIKQNGIDVGTPTASGDIVAARSKLEHAADVATRLLLEGRTLTGYDFEEANVSGCAWRAGLELAARRLIRDNIKVEKVKVGGRGGYVILDKKNNDDNMPVTTIYKDN